MDPFTIAASAFAILACVKEIAAKVARFKTEAGRIQETIADLKEELYSLYSDIDNVHNMCQDPDFAAVAKTSPGTPQSNIFARLQANLASCTSTVKQLDDKVAEVDDGGNSFVHRGIIKYGLDAIAEDLDRMRKQIQTHRGSMHLSVTALAFCLQSHSMKLEERAGRLINIKMNRLMNVVELQSSELSRLRARFTSEQEQGQRISNEDTLLLHDLEDIHESTVDLRRRATKLIKSRTSTKHGESTFEPVVAHEQEESVAANDGMDDGVWRPVIRRGITAPERRFTSPQHDFTPPIPHRIASTPSASAHDPHAIGRLMSPEDFENALSSIIADAVREKSDPEKPFKEEIFIKIGILLGQVGKLRWAERPRTYFVLRMIDEVQAMDGFVLEGLKDIHFPYTEKLLPTCLASPSSRHDFLSKQSLVMSSRAVDLVRGGPHRHFNKSADIHFTFVRNLGNGGSGTVDLVRSHLSSQIYAHKRIMRSRTFTRNKQTLAMFEQEIHNLKRLEHIHLVKLVGSYTDPKFVGLIMDPVADTDLKRYLATDPFPKNAMKQLRCFFGCLASAMVYLHEQNCRHKDIKPANILIKGETVLITDFGTSLDWTELEADTTHGRPAAFTNTYAAPEVAHARPRKTSADIWSLGCVFLEMTSVLKGIHSEERKRFFQQSHTHSTCYHDNQDTVGEWIRVLSEKGEDDQEPLHWIKRMVVKEPWARIEAGALFNEIVRSDETGRYYGLCCATNVEGADSSWHGSDSEEDVIYDTSSATKSSPTLHTVSWSSLDQPLTPESAGGKRIDTPGKLKSAKLVRKLTLNRSKPVPSISKRRANSAGVVESLRDPVSPMYDRQANARMNATAMHEIGTWSKSAIALQSQEDHILSLSRSLKTIEGEAPNGFLDLASSLKLIKERSDISKASADPVPPLSPYRYAREPVSDKKHGLYDLPVPRHPLPFRRKVAAKPRPVSPSLLRPDSPDLESHLHNLWAKKDGLLETYVNAALEFDNGDGIRTTPLHIATRLKDPTLSKDIVKLILDKSDLANVADPCLNTPLHFATACNRLIVVRYLLNHGADVGKTNSRGQNAVHTAVRMHNPGILSLLLRHTDASVLNAKDDRGRTPLHLACARGYPDIVSILLDYDAALDPIGEVWRNPNLPEKEDAYEEINELLEQARDDRGPDAAAAVPDPTGEPTISYHDLTFAAKSDGPPVQIESCRCEVCNLLAISTNMGESRLESYLHCKCRDCFDQLAIHTISDQSLVQGTLDVCSCLTCTNSRSVAHTLGGRAEKDWKSEGGGDEDESGEYCNTSFEYATIDDRYESELLTQKNQPPCECTECNAKRLQNCEKVLSEGRLKSSPYRKRPTKALKIITNCMNDGIDLAAKMEDIALVILDQGADINYKSTITGMTLLDVAVAKGNISLAQLLLNRGAELDDTLNYAAYNNASPIMAYLLLRHGAEVNIIRRNNSMGLTLFRSNILSKNHEIDLFKVFMRYGPIIESKVGDEDRTALHDAIITRNIEMVTMLLDAGASTTEGIKASGGNYFSLPLAIQSRSPPIVRLVLSRFPSAIVHHTCGDRPNALIFACFNSSHGVLAELLSATTAVADIATTDSRGRTCLHVFAMGAQAQAEVGPMLDLLVTQYGAALDAEDEEGNTPLHHAVMVGNLAMVQGLMNEGACEYAQNKQGKIPLDLARRKKNREIVTVLGSELKGRWYKKT